jgi:hypothetical protein
MMSDLLWYFQRPVDPIFANLKYADFYAEFYFKTLDLNQPLAETQWFIDTVQSSGRTQAKVLCRRTQRSRIVTCIHMVPPRIGELFYM